MRTNDPRADSFSVYRKEAAEFDRDYAKKYDEDLNSIYRRDVFTTFLHTEDAIKHYPHRNPHPNLVCQHQREF